MNLALPIFLNLDAFNGYYPGKKGIASVAVLASVAVYGYYPGKKGIASVAVFTDTIPKKKG
ncbi:MAG: hypothetical protein DRR19_31165 [Candidatus Parabeggiatoa sp. nov. 1]|nr:MAG: hypothetical protein DRR19_31165 [Gammaproteobacteria bacterium]